MADGTRKQDRQITRSSKACQSCRNLKSRCIPSEVENNCQRCLSAKRQCIWEQPQPRVKFLRTGTTRMSQMEKKIDGLVALLAAQNKDVASSPANGEEPDGESQSIARPDSPNHCRSSSTATQNKSSTSVTRHPPRSRRVSRTLTPDGSGNIPLPASNLTDSQKSHQNVAWTELLTASQVEELLDEFRSNLSSFPFVAVPPGVTAQQLRVTKPTLLFAILATSMWRDRALQLTLEELFRQELARKMIFDRQKNLELVQAILVYLAWYHHFFQSKTEQVYPLLQFAVGMIMDLYLDQRRRKASIVGYSQPKHPMTPAETQETRRAFLGCYFMSSVLSVTLSWPNLLKNNESVTQCATALRDEPEIPTDLVIGDLVKLHAIYDEIRTAFRADDLEPQDYNNVKAKMQFHILDSNLKSWQEDLTYDLHSYRLSKLSYHFISMELHSIGLRLELDSDSASRFQQAEVLSTCFEAGKAYVDGILALPSSDYPSFSIVDWMRLPYVLIMLTKLSLPRPNWDRRIAQETLRLDLCLDSLAWRLRSLTTYDATTQPRWDFWYAMTKILRGLRVWYTKKIQEPDAGQTDEEEEESPLKNICDPEVMARIAKEQNEREVGDKARTGEPAKAVLHDHNDAMRYDLEGFDHFMGEDIASGYSFFGADCFDSAMMMDFGNMDA